MPMPNPVCEVEVRKDSSGWGGYARRRPQPKATPKFISKSMNQRPKPSVRVLGMPASTSSSKPAWGSSLPASSSQAAPSAAQPAASSISRPSVSTIESDDPVARRSGGWGASQVAGCNWKNKTETRWKNKNCFSKLKSIFPKFNSNLFLIFSILKFVIAPASCRRTTPTGRTSATARGGARPLVTRSGNMCPRCASRTR